MVPYTPPQFNMEAEHDGFQKEPPFPGSMLNFRGVAAKDQLSRSYPQSRSVVWGRAACACISGGHEEGLRLWLWCLPEPWRGWKSRAECDLVKGSYCVSAYTFQRTPSANIYIYMRERERYLVRTYIHATNAHMMIPFSQMFSRE